jgi:hypothetical protein
LESGSTEHGPFSTNKPISEELPGPPFIQMESGAFSGSFLDSKNQKNVLIGYGCSSFRSPKVPAGKCTYPEYDFTPSVVSQIPGYEFTISIARFFKYES